MTYRERMQLEELWGRPVGGAWPFLPPEIRFAWVRQRVRQRCEERDARPVWENHIVKVRP